MARVLGRRKTKGGFTAKEVLKPQCAMAVEAVECLARVTKRAICYYVGVCYYVICYYFIMLAICYYVICYYVGDAKYLAEMMQRAWGTTYENNHKEQIATLRGLQVRTSMNSLDKRLTYLSL